MENTTQIDVLVPVQSLTPPEVVVECEGMKVKVPGYKWMLVEHYWPDEAQTIMKFDSPKGAHVRVDVDAVFVNGMRFNTPNGDLSNLPAALKSLIEKVFNTVLGSVTTLEAEYARRQQRIQEIENIL